MSEEQRTIKSKVSFSGIGVHTGKETTVTLLPGEVNQGIVFRRIDIERSPEIEADVGNVSDTRRGTTLSKGETNIRTTEHLLAVLYAFGVDNCVVELDGEEIPIDDGSAVKFTEVITKAGILKQTEGRRYLKLSDPLVYSSGEASISYFPDDEFSLTYIIDFDNEVLGTQYMSYENNTKFFKELIAPARTFILFEDVERLQKAGLIKGGSLDNAIVVKGNEILNNSLRHDKEFVSHKILDFLGDLSLSGLRIKGNIVAVKAGHDSHIEFVKELIHRQNMERILSAPLDKPKIDISGILSYLPHRYPFLLVDKITHLDEEEEVVIGVKNVTYNEQYFTGHFPDEPIMPGVLIIEAMAQAGGVLLLSTVDDPSSKLVYFISIDNVKFRKTVRPGDCLVFKLEGLRLKARICHMKGYAYIGEDLSAEAEFKAMLVDKEGK